MYVLTANMNKPVGREMSEIQGFLRVGGSEEEVRLGQGVRIYPAGQPQVGQDQPGIGMGNYR